MRIDTLNIAVLLWQTCLLAGSIIVVWLFATYFPFPSPLIKTFLPPEKRWPAAQVRLWVRGDSVPKGFVDFFSRDPDRIVPAGTNVVAPADGVVRNIIRTPEWTYVDIALSFWDVHVQRSPVAGRVLDVIEAGDVYMDGEYKNMVYLKDKMAPVQKVITFTSHWGKIKLRLVTSLIARRIRVWVHAGERVEKGQRIGRILLGSTVILQLPPDMPVAVEQWQRVVAGQTIVSSAPVQP